MLASFTPAPKRIDQPCMDPGRSTKVRVIAGLLVPRKGDVRPHSDKARSRRGLRQCRLNFPAARRIARALAAKPQRVIRDAVVVMQHVLVVEPGPNAALFAAPKAGYTNLALPSVPEWDPDWLNHLLAARGEHA